MAVVEYRTPQVSHWDVSRTQYICDTEAELPVSALDGDYAYCNDTNSSWTYGDATWSVVGGGSAAWGDITGTLGSQTDLQTALDGKSDTSHTHAQLHDRLHSITSGTDHTFPGGSTFLRADGTFASPPGGSEAFPIGAVFIAVVSTNPATLLGYGTWSAFGAGRVLVGLDSGDTDFDTVEETGGAKTHILVEAEIPAHVHGELAPSSASSGAMKFAIDTNASGSQAAGINTASAGGGGAHNNLQPYITVYMWKRTA